MTVSHLGLGVTKGKRKSPRLALFCDLHDARLYLAECTLQSGFTDSPDILRQTLGAASPNYTSC